MSVEGAVHDGCDWSAHAPNSSATLTTWLMPETLDWRIVTASPIEGFMFLLFATAEARKARDVKEVSCCRPTLEITLENILL